MAEHVGIEPTHPLLNDRLAICCLNRSANAPKFLYNYTLTGIEPAYLKAIRL